MLSYFVLKYKGLFDRAVFLLITNESIVLTFVGQNATFLFNISVFVVSAISFVIVRTDSKD